MSKTLYMKTYGCQMNVADSARMHDVLAPMGYAPVTSPQNADLVILNTCHIRENAAQKLYSDLGRIHAEKDRLADSGKRMLIAVAGCVAQAEGEEILARAPYVDMVIGSQSYHHLPDMIAAVERHDTPAIELDFPEIQKFDLLPQKVGAQGHSAFVSIQEGCDKFCTFCVVPYTRGAEYSRPVAAIVDEVRQHVAHGALEVTLLGQNVNAYHGDDGTGNAATLAHLFHQLARIDGLKRLRYSTSHPRDVDAGLIAAHGEIEILMPHLHLPVQSGSNAILKAMNRKHTADAYMAMIDKFRAVRPDIAVTSDFIVGFPGETDRDFNDTLRLVESVGFAAAYSFVYSPRPGTPAADKTCSVSAKEKSARLETLQALLLRQQTRFNESKIGTVQPVLFERAGKKPGQRIGKSPYNQSVVIDHPVDEANPLVDVHITHAYGWSCKGSLPAHPVA